MEKTSKYETEAGEFEVLGKKHKESENFRLHWLVEVTDNVLAKVQEAYELNDVTADPKVLVYDALNSIYPDAKLDISDFDRTNPEVANERAARKVERTALREMKAEERKVLAAASSAEKTVALAFMKGMKEGKTEGEIVTALRAEGVNDETLKIYFPKIV